MAGRTGRADPAAEVWRALYDYCQAGFHRSVAAAADRGLTPGDLKALLWLAPGDPRSMRELADQWGSDASTVTWLVDRLEDQGLVERRPHATDRRVKVVALTEKGVRLRTDLLDQMYHPPAAFAHLTTAELAVLRKLVAELT